MLKTPDRAGRRWARLLTKLHDLAEEYGRAPGDRRALHFAAMQTTLLTVARIAELHGVGGRGWTTLIASAPPDGHGLNARLSVSIIATADERR